MTLRSACGGRVRPLHAPFECIPVAAPRACDRE
jgi:hypothetical protein